MNDSAYAVGIGVMILFLGLLIGLAIGQYVGKNSGITYMERQAVMSRVGYYTNDANYRPMFEFVYIPMSTNK